jgi:hypothetical protein
VSEPALCSDRDLQEARLLQGKLRELLNQTQPGNPDIDSLKEVRRLCDRALLAVDDEFCQDQLCEVERHAVNLLSPGGVLFQRRLILESLDAIQERLAVLKALAGGLDPVASVESILAKR